MVGNILHYVIPSFGRNMNDSFTKIACCMSKRISLKVVSFLTIWLSMSLTVFAQNTISGKVLDDKGQPVAGASVSIKKSKIASATDAKGEFQFSHIAGTNIVLEISSIGFYKKEVLYTPGNVLTVVLYPEVAEGDVVVVTGVFDKRKRLEASVAISTVDAKTLAKTVPVSATDVLKNMPGIYVNSANGEIRNTVYSRGVSAGSNDGSSGFYYVSMQEDGLPVTNVTYSNYGPDYFLRTDATIGRVEAVRGGTASILGANAPGGIFNYIMKEGGQETTGEIRTRSGLLGDGRSPYYRADINVGGPMGKGWFWDAGGFYRSDNSPTNPGYPINLGGQFRANVVKKYKTGQIKVYAKYLDDRNNWNQAIPTVDFKKPRVLDGFSRYDALYGPIVSFNYPVNQTGNSNVYNGRDLARNKDKSVGFTWEQRLGGGWTFNNSFRTSQKNSNWNLNNIQGSMPVDNLYTYLYTAYGGNIANATAGTYSFRNARTGNEYVSVLSSSGYDFNVISGSTPGSTIASNSFFFMPLLSFKQDVKETLDQFSINKRLKNMSFTVGGFYGHSNVEKGSGGAGAMLATMEKNPQPVLITRTNTDGSIDNVTNSDGVLGIGAGRGFNYAKQSQLAFFFGHNWQITPKLNLDWGLRYEDLHIKGNNQPSKNSQSTTGGTDGNPHTLYDNFIGSIIDTFAFDKEVSTISYSAGLNYKLDNTFSIYARFSEGRKAPDLDIYFNASNKVLAEGLNPISQKITQIEAGIKVQQGRTLGVFITPFYSLLSNVPNIQYFVDPSGSPYYTPAVFNKFRTIGLELESDYRFTKNFNVKAALTLQKGKALEYSTWLARNPGPADDTLITYKGNEQDNLPRMMFNLTPSYNTDKFYAQLTWSFMGKRQANAANAFFLPSFSQFNLSTGYDISRSVNLGLAVNNLFNSYGVLMWFTPGNYFSGLDRQGFTKQQLEEYKNSPYSTTAIQARSYFLTATFKF
jgi:outer membrane receptor protein involved in Fe transport